MFLKPVSEPLFWSKNPSPFLKNRGPDWGPTRPTTPFFGDDGKPLRGGGFGSVALQRPGYTYYTLANSVQSAGHGRFEASNEWVRSRLG